MIKAIVAMAENRVIGCNGALPWYIPEDLKRFKRLTTGQTVVMGRKTFESIGKPLPNRLNLVLSSQPISFAQSYQSVEALIAEHNGFWVIGGEQVYAVFLPLIQRIELTLIDGEFQGDAFFPRFESDFNLIKSTPFEQGEYRSYQRK